VPLDHFSDTGRTTEVAFVLRRHDGPGRARGVFLTATGGPGTSGIASAVSYTEAFAPGIRARYDIAFFDQRGAGRSGGFTCPNAALAWYLASDDPSASTATTGLGARASDFVASCLAESQVDRSQLPYYATRQAAEDLEAFRIWLGADRLTLYGESYGTQLVQAYAAAHPDRVRALLLDGPVDLAVSGPDYWVEGARAFEASLVGTLLDCAAQRPCTADVGAGSALATYDALTERLAGGPIEYPFVRADGRRERRAFTSTDLVNAASAYLYSEDDRMLLQRAVAAASRGELWYLARLAYLALGQDPETGKPIPDPSYSDATYYAVECTDYDYFAGSPEERADAYLAFGREQDMATNRMGAIYYGDLPCAFWPARPAGPERPAPIEDPPYPMLVLGATLDPATPWANAERIFARGGRLSRLIVKPGGPHIIYGRGEACPDDLVTDFLVRDRLPPDRRTVCSGDVADDYVRLPPPRAARYESTEAALSSVDDQIVYSADYWGWDAQQALRFGCPFGGWIRYVAGARTTQVRMARCSWSRGLALTGTAVIDDVEGGLTMEVRANGRGPRVTYERGPKGHRRVDGELSIHRAGRARRP
jgi:pimeloyl-ACP methyl ester carboxylesterase